MRKQFPMNQYAGVDAALAVIYSIVIYVWSILRAHSGTFSTSFILCMLGGECVWEGVKNRSKDHRECTNPAPRGPVVVQFQLSYFQKPSAL